MKLRVYVLDFGWSERTRKIVRVVAAGVVVTGALGIGVALANVPNTFNTGDVLSSSKMNENFASLDTRLTNLENPDAAPPTTPSGTIVAFGGIVPPTGWVLCDGSAVMRSGQYAALFAAIGTSFGGGDGVTTFNLPDLRGRFLRGFDGDAGRDPDETTRTPMTTGGNTGNAVGTVEDYQIQSHTHYMTQGFQCGWGNWTYGGNNWDCQASTQINYAAATGGNETRPVNAVVNFIIKY